MTGWLRPSRSGVFRIVTAQRHPGERQYRPGGGGRNLPTRHRPLTNAASSRTQPAPTLFGIVMMSSITESAPLA